MKILENIFAVGVSEEKVLLLIKRLLATANGKSDGITVNAHSLSELATESETCEG